MKFTQLLYFQLSDQNNFNSIIYVLTMLDPIMNHPNLAKKMDQS